MGNYVYLIVILANLYVGSRLAAKLRPDPLGMLAVTALSQAPNVNVNVNVNEIFI